MTIAGPAMLILAGCGAPGSPGQQTVSTAGQATADVPTDPPAVTAGSPTTATTTTTATSSVDLPTISRPPDPPSTPSDQIGGIWMLGTVTVGGTGPCYGFGADDGRRIALYGPGAGALEEGSRLRVLVRAPGERQVIDCGPEPPLVLVQIKPAG